MDKIGRRNILNGAQILVTAALFSVGATYYADASRGNAAAATGLVSVTGIEKHSMVLISAAGSLQLLDCVVDDCIQGLLYIFR